MEGAGKPVVVTVNVPATPTVKVAAFALVIAGGWRTVSVNDCGAVDPTTLAAVKLSAYVPPVPRSGVPLSVPVPSPLSLKVTPPGRATPPRAIEGAGKPVVVTVKVPAVPTVNVAAFELVMVGALFTVSVIACEPVQPTLSVATNVSGNEPSWVGVPSSTPAVEKPIPAGSVPVNVHVVAPAAPVAVKPTGPYAPSLVASGRVDGLTPIVPQSTWRVTVPGPGIPCPSSAW